MKKINIMSIISLVLLIINILLIKLYILPEGDIGSTLFSVIPAVMYLLSFIYFLMKKSEHKLCYPNIVAITSFVIAIIINPICTFFSYLTAGLSNFG